MILINPKVILGKIIEILVSDIDIMDKIIV